VNGTATNATLALLLLLLGSAASWPVVAATAPTAAETLKIGLLLPPEENRADSLRRGVETVLRLYNRTSTVPATLVVRGRQGQWGDDGDETGHLVLDDGVRVLIAPPGGVPSHLLLQVAGRTQTPVIALSPDLSVTGAGIPWMVRMVPSIAQEYAALLPLARRWVAVVPEGRDGRELREARRDLATVAHAAGDVPLKVVGAGPGNLEAILNEAVSGPEPERPEGVLLWLPSRFVAGGVALLRDRGFQGVLAGPRLLREPGALRQAGPAAKGFAVADFAPDGVPAGALDRFLAEFGREGEPLPDGQSLAAADAASLALQLLQRAGDLPLRRLFPLGEPGAGLTGPWRFDAAGNRRLELRVFRWTGDHWTRPL